MNRNSLSALEEAEHRTVDSLLPWYVNDTLHAHDRARVQAHLQVCYRCREELEFLTDIQLTIAVSDDTVPTVPSNWLENILARTKNRA